ncbi:hypothetical protein, partial [Enterococcus faecium]
MDIFSEAPQLLQTPSIFAPFFRTTPPSPNQPSLFLSPPPPPPPPPHPHPPQKPPPHRPPPKTAFHPFLPHLFSPL